MTWSPDELLQAAAAFTPAAVLRRLARAGGPDGRPLVSLFLSGGKVVAGLLVRIGDDYGQDVAVLAAREGGRLSYVLLANVVAVEVFEPAEFQDILTDGRLPQPVTGEPVTALMLRRDFAPSADFPVQVDWAALPEGGPVLVNLGRLLQGLRDVASEVRSDDMGRQAWSGIRTVRVAHRSGAALAVQAVPGGLSAHADLTAALPRDLASELSQQIYALL